MNKSLTTACPRFSLAKFKMTLIETFFLFAFSLSFWLLRYPFGHEVGRTDLLLAELGNTVAGGGFWWRVQEFKFESTNFQMPVTHQWRCRVSSLDIMNLKFSIEVWTGSINVEVERLQMMFKTTYVHY